MKKKMEANVKQEKWWNQGIFGWEENQFFLKKSLSCTYLWVESPGGIVANVLAGKIAVSEFESSFTIAFTLGFILLL